MQISLEENKAFHHLLSGEWLNSDTTGAFLAAALRETLGPGGIAAQHLTAGQGEWRPISKATAKRKGSRLIFVQSGRVRKAIMSGAHEGSLRDWGSSADINSRGSWTPKRYSANGMYASLRVNKKESSLTVGFNGRYKHSSGFTRVRRELARERLGRKKITAKEMRRAVSVGDAERRLAAINADRASRGMKRIRKTAAMGATGMTKRGHALARGKDNLAYADIVQRGKFQGVQTAKGQLFNPKGVSAAMRRGKPISGSAVFGLARPLLPYKRRDEARLAGSLKRVMDGVAREMNRG